MTDSSSSPGFSPRSVGMERRGVNPQPKNNMKKPIQFRQGDVLIERISKLAKKPIKPAVETPVILAHGSATGHSHQIENPALAVLEESKEVTAPGDLNDSATMTNSVMVLTGDTAVIHQEHSRIELPSGNYIVRRQREYSPTEIRNVQD